MDRSGRFRSLFAVSTQDGRAPWCRRDPFLFTQRGRTMPKLATRSLEPIRRWPLTREAREQLLEEIARLRGDLTSLAGQGLEEGIVRLPMTIAIRRLETLRDVLDRCELVDDTSCAAIGRRARLREDDGEPNSYEIVFPGDGDPSRGRISADSPIGAAVLGARPGDVVEVRAPAGPWSVTVLAVN
jgi:transcription elongation factor GreA